MQLALTGLVGLLLLSGIVPSRGQFLYSPISSNANTIAITGYTGSGGNVVIPSFIGNQTVLSIGDYAFYNCTLTSVTIPDSVTTIGVGAFADCVDLTSASFGNGVALVDDYAFYDCGALKNLALSTNLVTIGDYAFYWCQSLENLVIPNRVANIGLGAFEDSGLTNVSIPSSVLTVGEGAFGFCAELAGLSFAPGLKSVASEAFVSCGSLGNVIIPGSVTNIGDSAFQGCTLLSNVTISAGIRGFGNAAFAGDALAGVSIPATITNIGIGAFRDNSVLVAISVDKQNPTYSSVNGVLFDKTGLNLIEFPGGMGGSYALPGGVTNIGADAFCDCSNLTSITLPSSIVALGDFSFYGCGNLTSLTIPGNVAGIGNYAFASCDELVTINCEGDAPAVQPTAFNGDTYATLYYFPCTTGWTSPFAGVPAVQSSQSQFTCVTNYVTVTITGYSGTCGTIVIPTNVNGLPVVGIGSNAFNGSPYLTAVTIPGGIASIGDYAFANCMNLSNVVFTGSAPAVGSNVFLSDTNAVADYLPCTGGWSSSFAGLPAVQWWPGIFGYQINGGGVTITNYTGNCASVTIPSSFNGLPVTSIGASAFYFATNLTSVTIPAGVTNIGKGAFQFCIGLSNVNIPEGVISIGIAAFDGCTSLTNVTLPRSVRSVGAAAFQFCFNLTTVAMNGAVTNIGDSAFNGCSGLTNIYFGGNAPALGLSTFNSDPLVTAYYLPGTTGWSNFSSLTGVRVASWDPSIQTVGGGFGISNNQFGFDIVGAQGATFAVASATDLANAAWIPVQTMTLTNGTCHFSDPQWSNAPIRFYQLTFP